MRRQEIQWNKRFLCLHEKKRPYVILKWAQTADGFVDRKRSFEDLKIHKNKDLKHEYQANSNHLLGSLQPFLYKLINSETLNERQKITNHIMMLAKQRLVLKKDERIKDPERHTGDTEADYKSNNRKA